MKNHDDMADFNPKAKAALLAALDDQLKSDETPEVKAELDRLLAVGIKKAQAKEMMALILGFHITSLVRGSGSFDYAAYLAELRRLPDIDYDRPL